MTHSALRRSYALMIRAALTFTLLVAIAPAAFAQRGGDTSAGEDFPVTVKVSLDGEPVSGAPVFLRAARQKGPFEPSDPKPQWERSGITGADGTARFDSVPMRLARQGLRLHAVATHDGIAFKSATSTPTPGLSIDLPVYERGFDPSTLRTPGLRMIIEPWEDYLIFTQMWTLSVDGDRALDTSLLADEKYDEGIPLELPLKAKGINVMGGSGQTKVINSTVYWKGVLVPGQPVTFQVRYSMSVRDSTFVYDQPLDRDLGQLEIIIPLETNYKQKLPRLNNLGLKAPGFASDQIRSGFNIPGLRPDKEFIHAKRVDVPAADRILFKLYNLPYQRPRGPWIALGLGALGVLIVLAFAWREHRGGRSREQLHALREQLAAERDALLGEIGELERDFEEGLISTREYERELSAVRARTALILKKLEELDAQLDAPAQE